MRTKRTLLADMGVIDETILHESTPEEIAAAEARLKQWGFKEGGDNGPAPTWRRPEPPEYCR